MNKTLRYGVLAGLFFVPFIPLIVFNDTFFPFITGKNFVFRIIVELITGGWLILASIDRTYRPKKSWLMIALGIFVAVMFFADITGVYPYKSFWSNYERMEGWVTLIHLCAYFIVMSSMVRTQRLWSWFFSTSIVASLIMVIIGFVQLTGHAEIHQGGVRLDGTLGNATYLAVYMLFHIFIALYLMATPEIFILWPFSQGNQPRVQKTVIGSVVVLLQAIILYYTATRGAVLGLIGGIALAAVLIALFERKLLVLRRISLGAIIAVLIVIVGFFAIKNTDFVKKSPVLSRFSSISRTDATTESRFMIWNMAFQGFKERPLLGWGQENFNYVFNKYYNPKMYAQEQWFDRTHNIFFDWLIAGGILGLASYFLFYGSVIWLIWKKTENNLPQFSVAQKSIISGLLLGYFIHNFFVFDNIVSYIMFFSVAAYVASRTTIWATVQSSKEKPVRKTMFENRVLIPTVVVVMFVVMYVVNVKAILANQTLIAAITPSSQTSIDLTPTTENFKKALAYNSFGTSEIREQLLALADQVVSNQSQAKGNQDLVMTALNEMKKQIQDKPGDARYYVLLGSFLNHAQQKDAVSYLAEAAKLSPRKQTILFELGNAYLINGDAANASATFKQAYEAEITDVNAKIAYAAVSIYLKNFILADSLLSTLPQQTVYDSNDILNAYNAAGQYNKVLEIWKFRVTEAPHDPQNHVHLATAYLLVSDIKDAQVELEIAMKQDTDPNHALEYKNFIDQIKQGKNPLQAQVKAQTTR